MSGWSIDHLITDPITGAKWDLTDRNQQKRILKKVEIEKPYMIFMAPLKDTISISPWRLARFSVAVGDSSRCARTTGHGAGTRQVLLFSPISLELTVAPWICAPTV